MQRSLTGVGLICGSVLGAASALGGNIYTFSQWTTNGNTAVASQLMMEVLSYAGGVEFKFSNAGPVASTITDMYFDDASPVMLGASSINNSYNTGLAFSATSPSGFGLAGFTVDRQFKADPPPPQNGINIGEALGIRFALSGGTTIADIETLLDEGALRIGLHVQGIAGLGGSEKFVTTANTPIVPLPQGAGLASVALLALGARRRRLPAAV